MQVYGITFNSFYSDRKTWFTLCPNLHFPGFFFVKAQMWFGCCSNCPVIPRRSAVFPGGSEDAGRLLGSSCWAAERRFRQADFPAPARRDSGRQHPPGERLTFVVPYNLSSVLGWIINTLPGPFYRRGSQYFSLCLFSAAFAVKNSSTVHMCLLVMCCTIDETIWAFVVPKNVQNRFIVSLVFASFVMMWCYYFPSAPQVGVFGAMQDVVRSGAALQHAGESVQGRGHGDGRVSDWTRRWRQRQDKSRVSNLSGQL